MSFDINHEVVKRRPYNLPPVRLKYKAGDIIGNWTVVSYTGTNGVYVMRCACGTLRLMHAAGGTTRGECMLCSQKRRSAKQIRTTRPASAIVAMGKNRIRLPEIIKAVSLTFDVPEAVLLGASRRRKHSTPRQVAIYLARELTKLSLQHIAGKFNRLCHTTCVHAIGSIRLRAESEPELSQKVSMIRNALMRVKELRESDETRSTD